MGMGVKAAVCLAVLSLSRGATATSVTVWSQSFTYPGISTVSETIPLGGTTNYNWIEVALSVGVFSGPPAPDMTQPPPWSGYTVFVNAIVSDDLGDSVQVSVDDNNCPCLKHPMYGDTLLFTQVPTELHIDLITDIYSYPYDPTFGYAITLDLPPGLTVTPLPASLPPFLSALGGLGLLARRQHRLRRGQVA